MTLKTSFFNKGIYKSTVKRYAWGMIAYFLILFFSTALILLLDKPELFSIYDRQHYIENPLILQDSYMIFPMLTSLAGTCIASLVLFRYIHSKKQAVFIHSLPASRKANYISTIAAGITLMTVPVLLNGAILLLMSFSDYSAYFGAMACMKWTAYNLLAIYMMFSCAVFCANLTGNSFAAVALNVILHSFLAIIVSVFNIMAEVFVYGFTGYNTLLQTLAETNFVYSVFSMANHFFRDSITASRMAMYVLVPLVFYVASYFLYKKRRLETSGDVAGFRCLNSVFKYGVTFLASMFAFAVFSSYINDNQAIVWAAVSIISGATYFALEMVLKKTIKVLYSWKGYVGFVVIFTSIILVFSFTSFFGYETRIPHKSDISEATIYNYYYCENEPYVADEEIIDMITATHSDMIRNKPIPKVITGNNYHSYSNTRIHIKYKLKNGKSMSRVYPISINECTNIMNRFYENDVFKKISEQVFMDESRITKIFVNHSDDPVREHDTLLSALRDDYMSMSYDEIYHYENYPQKYENTNDLYNIRISYTVDRYDGFKTYSAIDGYYINITTKFKNTVRWLKENGYAPVN